MVRLSSLSSTASGQAVSGQAEPRTAKQPQQAAALYEALRQQCERCLDEAQAGQPVSLGEIPLLIEQASDWMQADDTALLRFATTADCRFTLALHGANVAVLAVRLGLELGLRRQELVDCGIAALLHDVGMVKVAHLLQAHSLGRGEIAEIQEHPLWGERIARLSPQLPAMARTVIAQEHERADGSGYPHHLKADAIDRHAQLIGLLDVYEALTHDRPYRLRLLPAQAARTITEQHRSAFSRSLLRAFLHAITVYPVGSWVQLSSGDCAQVTGQSRRHPFSPTVSIRFDRLRQPYPQPQTLDLSRQGRLSVLQSVADPMVQWNRPSPV